MELMSPFLLCVLVAVLPQTSGGRTGKIALGYAKGEARDVVIANDVQQKLMLRKPKLLNIKAQLVHNISAMQSVFNDLACTKCVSCMERAIKAHDNFKEKVNNRPSAEELRSDVLTNKINHKDKRDIHSTQLKATEKTNKSKIEKNKGKKTITVTKYSSIDGQVFALKIKETSVPVENKKAGDLQEPASICQVYSVKKSHACDSVQGESLITAAKRKARKLKMKNEQKTNSDKITTTTQQTIQTSGFRKREVDNSQFPENFMLSIEDIY